MDRQCSIVGLIIVCSLYLITTPSLGQEVLTLEVNSSVFKFSETALQGFQECLCNDSYQTCAAKLDPNDNVMDDFTKVISNQSSQAYIPQPRYFQCYNSSINTDQHLICQRQSNPEDQINCVSTYPCSFHFLNTKTYVDKCVGIVWIGYLSLNISVSDNQNINLGFCTSDSDKTTELSSTLNHLTTVTELTSTSYGQNTTKTENTTPQGNTTETAIPESTQTLINTTSESAIPQNSNKKSDDTIFIAVGAGLAFILILTILIICVIIWRHRKHKRKSPHANPQFRYSDSNDDKPKVKNSITGKESERYEVVDLENQRRSIPPNPTGNKPKSELTHNNISKHTANGNSNILPMYEEVDLEEQSTYKHDNSKVTLPNGTVSTANLTSTFNDPQPVATTPPEEQGYTSIDYTTTNIDKNTVSTNNAEKNSNSVVDATDTGNYSGVDECRYSTVRPTFHQADTDSKRSKNTNLPTNIVNPDNDKASHPLDNEYEEAAQSKPNSQNVYSRLGEEKRKITDPYNMEFLDSQSGPKNVYSKLGEQPRAIKDPYNTLLKPSEDPKLRPRATLPANRYERSNGFFPGKNLMRSNSDVSQSKQNYSLVPRTHDDSDLKYAHYYELHENDCHENSDEKLEMKKQNVEGEPYEEARPSTSVEPLYAKVNKSLKNKERTFSVESGDQKGQPEESERENSTSENPKSNSNDESELEIRPNAEHEYAEVNETTKIRENP